MKKKNGFVRLVRSISAGNSRLNPLRPKECSGFSRGETSKPIIVTGFRLLKRRRYATIQSEAAIDLLDHLFNLEKSGREPFESRIAESIEIIELR